MLLLRAEGKLTSWLLFVISHQPVLQTDGEYNNKYKPISAIPKENFQNILHLNVLLNEEKLHVQKASGFSVAAGLVSKHLLGTIFCKCMEIIRRKALFSESCI